MVSNVTTTGAVMDAQKTNQSATKLAEDFNEFLTLLTTQLQHQDPMDPMDSKEFTNQLVQFSQVEQSINTNQKLDNLVSLQMRNAASSALGYVGMDVKYQSADMHYDGNKPVNINYSLSKGAISAKANIYSETGELVYSMDVPRDVGYHEFTWDGTNKGGGMVEPGTYTVQISALDSEDEAISVKTAVSGNVRGVESQDGIMYLLIGERAVSIENVINVALPEETAAANETNDQTTDQTTDQENAA